MQEREWSFRDEKSMWGPGPWMDEPDKAQWTDQKTGLACLIVRNPMGALCGYVGVPDGHPLYKIGYSSCTLHKCDGYCEHSPESMLHVHGGLTFSDLCAEEDKEHAICHITEPGDPDPLWWLGFDCSHAGDISPRLDTSLKEAGFAGSSMRGDTYKNVTYVKAECAQLAEQVAALS